MARPAVARIWQGRTRASLAEEYARDEIRAYAGDDIEKTHHLPKDPEYSSSCRPT